MVRWHVRGLTDPGERLVESRALVAFLSGAMLDTDEIRLGFRAELQVALEKDPGFFFHDELSEDYAPVYFHEFMAAAGRHGLQFVADADPAELVLLRLSDETRRLIAALSNDRLEQQQYLDFVVGRRFRHTILCRADVGTSPGLRVDQVARCWFSSQGNLINPEKINEFGGVAVFERPGGLKLETDFLPGKLALQFLGEIAPARITFGELVQQTRARLTSLGGSSDWTEKSDADFARFLLEACVPRVAVIHGANPEISGTPGEHPVAFRVARVQAAAGPFVTSAYHHRVRLDERWSREFIARADGTQTLEQLANEIETLVSKDAGVDAEVWRKVRADLPAALALLARQGLIIG